jgi:hypothetical protein
MVPDAGLSGSGLTILKLTGAAWQVAAGEDLHQQ